MAHEINIDTLIANKVESNINTQLDVQKYAIVDDSLSTASGMKKTVRTRKAVSKGAEMLEMGAGNTGNGVEVTLTETEYDVKRCQDFLKYYDEQNDTDGAFLSVAVEGLGNSIPNKIKSDVFAEWNKTHNTFAITTACPSFDNLCDAIAQIKGEDPDTSDMFLLVNKKTKAALCKAIKDDVKYSDNYVVTGGITYISGVKVIVSQLVADEVSILATSKAVTIYNKKGTTVESDRNIDTKENHIVATKYFVIALTDEGYAVKIAKAVTTPTITTAVKATNNIAGACTGASEVEVYINGAYKGLATVSANAYTFNASVNLVAGDKVVVKAYAPNKAMAESAEFTVAV